MIQILVEKFFIAFLESRDFNSCKKRIKNFSTRFSLYDVIMAPDLENFSTENFLTKKIFFSKFSNGSIRKVIMLKEKFGDLHENLSFTRVTLARLLILFISIQFQVQYKVILYPRGSKEVHLFIFFLRNDFLSPNFRNFCNLFPKFLLGIILLTIFLNSFSFCNPYLVFYWN